MKMCRAKGLGRVRRTQAGLRETGSLFPSPGTEQAGFWSRTLPPGGWGTMEVNSLAPALPSRLLNRNSEPVLSQRPGARKGPQVCVGKAQVSPPKHRI